MMKYWYWWLGTCIALPCSALYLGHFASLSLHVQRGGGLTELVGRECVKMVISSITGNVFRERDG